MYFYTKRLLMKKKILLGAILSTGLLSYGQGLTENFDDYTEGEYIGVVSDEFSTWSGTVGGSEDAKISTAEAASGANSIYFNSSVAGGGPQDVVVPFGGEYNTGNFVFESNFYVAADRGAYFNFQGTEELSEMYSVNCQMVNDGQLILFPQTGGSFIETTFEHDTWFNLRIEVNLNTNNWELFIDDESRGSFTNNQNQISSIDIFPVNNAYGGNNRSTFYIDDFMYMHTPYTLPDVNAAVVGIGNVNGLATVSKTASVDIRNLGTTTINSFDVEVTYNGTTLSQSYSMDIASGDILTVDIDEAFELVGGANDIVATVSNVNGAAMDDDASDDTKIITIDPLVPATGKIVIGEEATGTWCGWCPRGAVYLDYMAEQYPDHFVGIAVHNGDPMVYEPYDSGINGLISGYPSLLVDRLSSIDPSAVESDFLERIVVDPKAVITVGADYIDGSDWIDISVTADFNEAVTGNYKLACVIVEDEVTGTGSGYNQANYYAGGGSGVMGGYELLPSSVPATMMVYQHVARVISPSFAGLTGSFPDAIEIGASHTVNFNLAIDPNWDLDNIHIVGILIAPDRKVDNAGFASISGAVENGFIESEKVVLATEKLDAGLDKVTIFPNPATDQANVQLVNLNDEDVELSIYTISGTLLMQKSYGKLKGDFNLPINVSQLAKGIYMVNTQIGERTKVMKLSVN